jgi:hypothetical protein
MGVVKAVVKKFKNTEDSKGKLGSMFSSDMMKLAEETKTIINKLKKGLELTAKQKKDMEKGIKLHEQKAKQIIKEVEAPGSTTKVSNLNKLKEIAKDGRKAYESKNDGGRIGSTKKPIKTKKLKVDYKPKKRKQPIDPRDLAKNLIKAGEIPKGQGIKKKSGGKLRGMGKALRGGGKVMRG